MLSAISLFTGIGGLDFGTEAAGFRTRVATELDAVACRVLRLNHKWPVLEGDLNSISTADILAHAGLQPGEADLLVGGPPCQPFSKSAYWMNGDTARLRDPRASTLDTFLRVLQEARPAAFLLENVQGLAYEGKDEGLRHLLRGVARINKRIGTHYQPTWQTINAADYGVPQVRKRVFIIGARDGTPFVFPGATHADPLRALNGLEPYRTSWDAIGDCTQPQIPKAVAMGGKWSDLLPTIPEGQNYLWHTSRGGGAPLFGWRTRYWSFLLKLAKDRPSWTIHAQPGSATGPFHWDNRRLTPCEMAALQTFPKGLKYECSHAEAQRMIGNAVPSLITEILGREIRRQLLRRPTKKRETLALLPSARGAPPPPERVAPLPKKFRALIGSHPDHPGQGKGPAYETFVC